MGSFADKYKEMEKKPGGRRKKKQSSTPKRSSQARMRPPTKSQSRFGEKALIVFCGLGCALSLWFVFSPDINLASLANIRLGLPKIFAQDAARDPNLVKAGDQEKKEPSIIESVSTLLKPDTAKVSMENTNINETLEAKRKELEKRERDLDLLSEDLESRKKEIDSQLKEIFEMRKQITSTLDSKVQSDSESLLKLVAVYSSMKPQSAAQIIIGLNEELAVKVLSSMKKQNAAAILNFIQPKKARSLSEKYAGLRK